MDDQKEGETVKMVEKNTNFLKNVRKPPGKQDACSSDSINNPVRLRVRTNFKRTPCKPRGRTIASSSTSSEKMSFVMQTKEQSGTVGESKRVLVASNLDLSQYNHVKKVLLCLGVTCKEVRGGKPDWENSYLENPDEKSAVVSKVMDEVFVKGDIPIKGIDATQLMNVPIEEGNIKKEEVGGEEMDFAPEETIVDYGAPTDLFQKEEKQGIQGSNEGGTNVNGCEISARLAVDRCGTFSTSTHFRPVISGPEVSLPPFPFCSAEKLGPCWVSCTCVICYERLVSPWDRNKRFLFDHLKAKHDWTPAMWKSWQRRPVHHKIKWIPVDKYWFGENLNKCSACGCKKCRTCKPAESMRDPAQCLGCGASFDGSLIDRHYERCYEYKRKTGILTSPAEGNSCGSCTRRSPKSCEMNNDLCKSNCDMRDIIRNEYELTGVYPELTEAEGSNQPSTSLDSLTSEPTLKETVIPRLTPSVFRCPVCDAEERKQKKQEFHWREYICEHLREAHGWNTVHWEQWQKNEELKATMNVVTKNICGGCGSRFLKPSNLAVHFNSCKDFNLRAQESEMKEE